MNTEQLIERLFFLTLERNFQPGRPRSRANDHIIREAEAMKPTFAHIASVTTILPMVAAPPIDPVACRKISMNGKPVGEASAASISPRQNRTAMIIPKPREPLITNVSMIDRGATTDGRSISSDI